MKKKHIILLLLIIISLYSFSQEKQNHRYIVFDITGSMVGRGINSKGNIWKQSVNLLTKQLETFSKNELVTFYTFGKKLHKIGDFTIGNNKKSIEEILESLNRVETDDSFELYTCIFESLNTVIDSFNDKQINTIYLFTDGNQTSNDIYNCGGSTSLSVLSKFKDISEPYDYLYILKLTKDFHIENEEDYEKEKNIEIVPDAINNRYVNITPINHNIRVSKLNLGSSQSFKITGTGVDDISKELVLKTDSFVVEGNISHEKENINILPNTFSLKELPYSFDLVTYNKIQNIKSDIFNGKIDYTFQDGTMEKIVKKDNLNITIKIRGNSNIIFNNKNEEPKVIIEFID